MAAVEDVRVYIKYLVADNCILYTRAKTMIKKDRKRAASTDKDAGKDTPYTEDEKRLFYPVGNNAASDN